MNIPFQPQQPIYQSTQLGNANNGGNRFTAVQVPQFPGSFPRVNLNPQFQIGAYNNAEESYNFPRHTKYWNHDYNTNNPIGLNNISRTLGNAGNGGNRGGLTPFNPPILWGQYNLATLGVQGGPNQTFAYNPNQTNLEGGTKHVAQLPNVNLGLPVEQLNAANTPEQDQIRRYIAELQMQNSWMANDIPRMVPRDPLDVGDMMPVAPTDEPELPGNIVRRDPNRPGRQRNDLIVG